MYPKSGSDIEDIQVSKKDFLSLSQFIDFSEKTRQLHQQL